MKQNPYLGKFIVFEGLDGSGTTTQSQLLLKYLQKHNKKVHLTSEPTSYLIGGLIKSRIAGDWESSPECLQLLFTADRAYHLEKEIIPLLKRGIMVICTRYILSTLAYGSLEIKDRQWLLEINKKFILPNLIFLLKVRPEICIARIKKERFHRELFEAEEKMEKVFQSYQTLAKKFKNIYPVRKSGRKLEKHEKVDFSNGVYTIDGERPIEKVSEDIKSIAHSKLNL